MEVFDFINSVLSTIIEGIYGTIRIIGSIFNLIISITRILPNPLYSCLLGFLTLYVTIFTYKIIRKG